MEGFVSSWRAASRPMKAFNQRDHVPAHCAVLTSSMAPSEHAQSRSFHWTPSCAAKGKSASQNRYLARQKRDPFVRSRESTSYVSRSAFKLLQLDDRHSLFSSGQSVIDLGASPGGWTQVAVERTLSSPKRKGETKRSERPKVWALDRLELDPVVRDSGAVFLQGDFLEWEVQQRLRESLEATFGGGGEGSLVEGEGEGEDKTKAKRKPAQVDVILSDMMANTSGNAIRDSQASQDLLSVALQFASTHLRPGGSLVLKYFESPEAQEMRRARLAKGFRKVIAEKVEASRKESKEMFWVCLGRKREWRDEGDVVDEADEDDDEWR